MTNNALENLVCVFGLGMSGCAAARYLQRVDQAFFVVDTRINPSGKNEVINLPNCKASFFGDIPQEILNRSKQIILSPGVSPNINAIRLAKENNVDIVGDIEIFSQQSKNKIVAITGSNGKSTVTDLTYQMLKAAGINVEIGGNFGVPVLDFLPHDPADIYVLELSSFQLDTTRSLQADIAVVLNVSEDHMERYDSFEDYRSSKLSIFNGAKKQIVNADDKFTWPESKDNVVEFSIRQKQAKYHLQSSQKHWVLCSQDAEVISTDQLKITGSHNWSNVLAVIAIIAELNISFEEDMLQVLKGYCGLPHRFQLVSSNQLADWINDSKATNIGATLAALSGIDRNYYAPVILIAGGDAKESDLSPLAPALSEKVDYLVLIGKDRNLFQQLDCDCKKELADDMQEAVSIAFRKVKNTDSDTKALVLLSPACASLDMYQNFMARGDAFVEAVEACI